MRRILWVTALVAACKQAPSKLDEPTAPAPAGQSAQPAAPGATAPGELSGVVAETMDAGGYTYARLDRGSTSVWIAGPETKLAVGTKLAKMDGSLMQNFRSDTLKRTFEQIYFVNSFAIDGAPATAAAGASTPPAPAGGETDLSGVVVQTINASTYTYVQIDHKGTKIWLAGPETKLEVGSQLGAMKGSLMPNFHSDTLNRTFEEIYFVNNFNIAQGAIPNPHTGSGAAAAASEPPVEKIAPVAGGTTVADVIAKKDALVGKPVVVHGKVVKLNNGILGRNWIHLRDGSGAPGANDLLVTTDATAKVGDVVVARGTVATHQDFGAGYKYDVIVEKATLSDK